MGKKKAYVGTDGKFLYDVGTDTVSIVLANCTGDPVIEKKLEYREEDDSNFSHHGKLYSLNKVYEQLTLDATQPLLLKWIDDQIADPSNLSTQRFEKADSSVPVIVIKEGEKIWLLDGNHRTAKAKSEGKKWVRAYYITEEILANAKV